MKLTEEQASQVLYDDIWDEENDVILYEKVSEKIIDFDREKNSADKYIIIKDVKTGKKYGAILGDSPWTDQNEENAKEEWEELIPKKKNK